VIPAARDMIALEVNGDGVRLADLLALAAWNGELRFLRSATDAALIRQEAARRGIAVTNAELQQAADAFRAERGLREAAATRRWLRENRLTAATWERLLDEDVRARKLRAVLTEAAVEPFFAQHRLSFDAATVSHLIVGDEHLARELRAQVMDDGADFHALARQYSEDGATRPAGGYVGPVGREALDAAEEPAVFAAHPGAVVGPFPYGACWRLIKVEAVRRAVLDEPSRERIRAILFNAWLDQERRRARVRVPLLEEVAAPEP
jgi:parvulin-like peptidyl-prolyl isomerase